MKARLIIAAVFAAMSSVFGKILSRSKRNNIYQYESTYQPPPPQRTMRHYGDKDKARAHGIPKWLRQYAKRYGQDVDGIIQMHRQNPVPTLNEAAAAKHEQRVMAQFEAQQ